jgi:hypothetical protein
LLHDETVNESALIATSLSLLNVILSAAKLDHFTGSTFVTFITSVTVVIVADIFSFVILANGAPYGLSNVASTTFVVNTGNKSPLVVALDIVHFTTYVDVFHNSIISLNPSTTKLSQDFMNVAIADPFLTRVTFDTFDVFIHVNVKDVITTSPFVAFNFNDHNSVVSPCNTNLLVYACETTLASHQATTFNVVPLTHTTGTSLLFAFTIAPVNNIVI